MRVQCAENSFRDLDGAGNTATEQQFAVVANAPAYEIRISGSVIWRTGFSEGVFGNIGKPAQLRDLLKMVEQVTGPLGDDVGTVLEALKVALTGLSTALDYIEPFLTEPMFNVNGFLGMSSQAIQGEADPVTGERSITGVRTTLDAAGSMSVLWVGPVGAVAGRLVVEAGEMGLNLWG
ncbi:MAG: hypothetical protein ACK5YO_20730, partial [Planctomyces sp.]